MSEEEDNTSTNLFVSPTKVLEISNDDGKPITYTCEYQTGTNVNVDDPDKFVTVAQFYDLIYPCNTSKEQYAQYIAEQILIDAATIWNILPNGDGCTEPQRQYSAWLFGVSSYKDHEFISDFGCQRLTPEGMITTTGQLECCQVVRAEMKFLPTGGYDIDVLQQFMKDQLDDISLTESINCRTAAIEPAFDQLPTDDARDNLNEPKRVPSAISSGEEQKSQEPQNHNITITGGFVIGLMVAAALGVFMLVYRRYRVSKIRMHNSNSNQLNKSDCYNNNTNTDDEDDFHVTVLSEEQSFPRHNTTLSSTLDDIDLGEHHFDRSVIDDDDDDDNNTPHYNFDLSHSFKHDVMGTYGDNYNNNSNNLSGGPTGPTTIQVVAPYPINEGPNLSIDDSEADDSWAQTDGTVASIEDRLEPITGEI